MRASFACPLSLDQLMPDLLYVTRRFGTAEPKATVVILHGYGADEEDLLGIGNEFPFPILAISLRAPIALPWGGFAWYHLEQSAQGLKADDTSRKVSEQMLLEQLPSIIKQEGGDASQVILMGFSQGAAMTYSLLIGHDLAAAGLTLRRAIILSGYIPRDLVVPAKEKRFDGLPLFISHGEFDELIPVLALDEAEGIFRASGADVRANLYEMGHGIDPEVTADLATWLGNQLP